MPGTTDRIRELTDEGMRALAGARTESDLLNVKGRYFGKKGAISEFLKDVTSLSLEDRKRIGQAANEARKELEAAFESRLAEVREAERRAREGLERLDVTLPGRSPAVGSRHPIARTMAEIIAVFQRLGFSVRGGPEVEKDYYNFEALNIPKDHPARDMQDTFYVDWPGGDLVLRTHTSPNQARVMEKTRPPVRVLDPFGPIRPSPLEVPPYLPAKLTSAAENLTPALPPTEMGYRVTRRSREIAKGA